MIRARTSVVLFNLITPTALFAACLIFSATKAGAQVAPSHEPGALWGEAIAEAVEAGKLEGRIDRGRALYEVCAECHLSNGAGNPDGTMPQLAGQHRGVLIKQLMDIRSGLRRNPSMYPYVARLDGTQDLADLTAHIETLPIPEDNGKGAGVFLEDGKRLYEENCLRCHGENGEGSADAFYPRLAGQHYRYLVRQLIDIAGGRRGNANPDMTDSVKDFSARDVANVADYVSRIHNDGSGSDPETRR